MDKESSPKLLSIEEAAVRLGKSKKTIYHWIERGVESAGKLLVYDVTHPGGSLSDSEIAAFRVFHDYRVRKVVRKAELMEYASRVAEEPAELRESRA